MKNPCPFSIFCYMIGRIIVGANYGDESKGTVTAYYTKNARGKVLNVLTNGGAQRGHSVVSDNGDFTFKHFGSGTCYNADSYFSQYFILNPMQFAKEYSSLNEKLGFFCNIKLYRNERCMWTTPYDQMFNLAIEESRGKDRHGSCGMGIWETVLRYEKMKTYDFDYFMDMPYPFKVQYLKDARTYFDNRGIKIPDELMEPWHSDFLIDHFLQDCITMDVMTKSVKSITEIQHDYDEIICENGQGLLLNSSMADEAHTTPSCTGSVCGLNILANELHLSRDCITTHYVTRPYLTRHGMGNLSTECDKKQISLGIKEDRTNHYNITQGDFRFGKLDLDKLRERIMSDYNTVCSERFKIELTHCDEMDRVKEFNDTFIKKNVHTFDSPKV